MWATIKGDEFNPLTGKVEPNGTSIIDVSNPAQPKLIVQIPVYKGARSRAVQIVDKFYGRYRRSVQTPGSGVLRPRYDRQNQTPFEKGDSDE